MLNIRRRNLLFFTARLSNEQFKDEKYYLEHKKQRQEAAPCHKVHWQSDENISFERRVSESRNKNVLVGKSSKSFPYLTQNVYLNN